MAAIAPQYLTIATSKGTASLPLYATGEWRARGTRVRRALIVIHGRLRNADAYFNLAHHALAQAGETANDTLLIVPQFVARDDVDAHGLQPNTLFWEWTSWMGGDDATGPVSLSSFDVLDTVLEALADAADYPDLEQVVIAGHSGGAQVVQRYAAVSHGDRALAARGVRTRYVVANPSTYLYFDAQRPTSDGHFAPLDTHTEAGAQANAWKYGLDNLPAYVERQHGACGTGDIEREYVGRDVVV
ncbi:MAG TPA: alpha/beta hydrolase, partial [Pararobbsia sp.]|nr:alpha/beta hydrolase [Pararobbsia sp.]